MVGCGSSGGNGGGFVASPGGGGNAGGVAAGTGTATFNFVRVQAPIAVPTATVNLRFRFYSGLNGTGAIVLDTTQPFAGTVTINNVPTTTLSSTVTALDGNGFPLSQFVANITVTNGGTTTINSASGTSTAVTFNSLTANPSSLALGVTGTATIQTTANFSNGDSVTVNGAPTTFGSSATSVATVAPTGVVTANLTGTANITCTLIIGGTTQVAVVPVTVGSGVATPPTVTALVLNTASPVVLPKGAISAPLSITATFTGGTMTNVGAAQGVVYTSDNANISVNNTDQIVTGAGALAGQSATITATFGGRQVQIQVQVSAATLTSVTVTPATASLPFGGFEQQIAATGVFSDATTVAIDPANLLYTGGTRFTVNAAGLLTTNAGGAAGTDTLTVTTNGGGLPVLSGTAQITVGTAFVQSLTVTALKGTVPEALPVTIVPGEIINYTVIANISDGTNALPSVDVTNFASLVVTSGTPASVIATGPRAVGIGLIAAPGAAINFAMNGAGAAGANVTRQERVIVVANQLVSVKYFYAGNEITQNQLNLPRGYVGVFEVEGTFTNGNVRRLTSAEYTVDDTGGPADGVTAQIEPAVRLFNDTFVITQTAGRFFDGLPTPGTSTANGVTVTVGGPSGTTFVGPNDGVRDGAGDGVDQTVDDLLGSRRQTTSAAAVFGSNNAVVKTISTFRAVAADWRQASPNVAAAEIFPVAAGFDPGAAFEAANGFDLYTINPIDTLEPTPGQFSREFSVTVTNPSGTVSVDSVAFANYPTEGNIARGTPRELEVRVSFPASVSPAAANAFPNFKLAEANIRFGDDNSDVAGPDVNQFHHRPTELGYISVTRNVPLNLATLRVSPTPLGGIAQQPFVTTPAQFTPFQAAMPPTTTTDTQPTYTAAVYANRTDIYGPAGGTSSAENGGFQAATDPGPGGGAEEGTDPSMPLQANKGDTQPDDTLSIAFTDFTNGTNGFPVTVPTLFTLDPGAGAVPVNIAVGGVQEFRTLVQFDQNQPIVDRSLDYVPRLNAGATRVVGEVSLATGRLTVAGILSGGGDTVTAADVAGNPINARGNFIDSRVPALPIGAATATVAINVP